MTRREALSGATMAATFGCLRRMAAQATGVHFNVAEFDRARTIRAADAALSGPILTITSVAAPGAKSGNGFFCDATLDAAGDVTGFTGHADLLSRMAAAVAALIAAWRLTSDSKYLERAQAQLQAWCITPQTRMTPTLDNTADGSATAAKTETDLRLNPLRFTLALAEFARAASFVCAAPGTDPALADGVRAWASELLRWFSESARGAVARDSTRADAIFWTMQASELARFARNDAVWRDCGHRFRDKLLRQLHLDGYFPYALTTQRPYAESMLLLECMGSVCESVSTPFESAWPFTLPDGRGMRAAVAWAYPFLQSRGQWPYPADTRRFSQQPMRENVLLLGGRAWNRQDYVDLWQAMKPADAADAEIRREHPVTQPALWAVRPPA
ncbi:alginate lyase family protein [Terriglobus aquaticus]|uniref:Alginate lyase family protein n=2 Tax=Terriglobus aquaticus TaxID=940139 RepID=A0ABW9KNZ0_9BACT